MMSGSEAAAPQVETFLLFTDPSPEVDRVSAAGDFYALLERLRDATHDSDHPWSMYPNLVAYAQICFWAIRKSEYAFAAAEVETLASQRGGTLRVLDVGCGVVPFCNWMSMRGHDVLAIDPLAADIQFLLAHDANRIYDSRVDYRVAAAEWLPLEDESVDLVTCVSVLEHMIPGNTRLALREIARVLRPGGRLVLTLDVAPTASRAPGEQPAPRDRRRYEEPFTAAALASLMDAASGHFEVDRAAVPDELRGLTWDDVHGFWRAAQSHDGREEPCRDYLAAGIALTRRPSLPERSAIVDLEDLLEGQRCLLERVTFYQRHAQQRLAVIRDLEYHASERLRIIGEQQERLAILQQHADDLQHRLETRPGTAGEEGRGGIRTHE